MSGLHVAYGWIVAFAAMHALLTVLVKVPQVDLRTLVIILWLVSL
jgi:hypothetical protein